MARPSSDTARQLVAGSARDQVRLFGWNCALAPDWVCEVLSPSTASLDRVKKLAVYAREQVGHTWLIDPAARTLEILRLDAGRWTILATHADADVVRAEPFDDVDLDLATLWSDVPA